MSHQPKAEFLRVMIERGASDRSYGLHVARLAGVPTTVVDRAQEILASLEKPIPVVIDLAEEAFDV